MKPGRELVSGAADGPAVGLFYGAALTHRHGRLRRVPDRDPDA